MGDGVRLAATSVIWLTLAAILIAAAVTGGDMVALAFILGIAAAISTSVIWESGKSKALTAENEVSKNKRNNRLSRLVDKLDEEEVYQLEDLLASRHDNQIRD